MGKQRFLYDKVVRVGSVAVVPSTNYQPEYEPVKIQSFWRDYVYRSLAGTKNATIEIVSPGSVAIATSACVLYGLNLTSSYTTLKLQKNVAGWQDVADFEYDAVNGRAICFFTEITVVEYRVVINDPNVASYVQLGVVMLGSYEELSRGYEYGASSDIEDTSDHMYSKKGYITVAVGYKKKRRAVLYEVLEEDEQKLESIYNLVGKEHPFVFISNSDQALSTMEYSIFKERFSRRVENSLFRRITLVWEYGIK